MGGQAGTRGEQVSRDQRLGGCRQAGTRGQVGELGPEVRWVSWDQRLGG